MDTGPFVILAVTEEIPIARYLGSGESNICCILDWRGKFSEGNWPLHFLFSRVMGFSSWFQFSGTGAQRRFSLYSGGFHSNPAIVYFSLVGRIFVSIFILIFKVFKGGHVTPYVT